MFGLGRRHDGDLSIRPARPGADDQSPQYLNDLRSLVSFQNYDAMVGA